MATKSTSTPLPHHVRAANLVHEMFEPAPDKDPTTEATRNISLTIPIGVLLVCDVLAKRIGTSRSAMASQLMSLGYGLCVEQMTPAQRATITKLLQAEDMSRYAKGKPGHVFEAVEG